MKQQQFLYLAVILLIFMLACGKKQAEIPAGIMPIKTMGFILMDINIAENLIQRRNPMDSVQDAQRASDIKFILKKHQMRDSVFYKSYHYYATHPELLKSILEENIAKIEKQLNQKNADSLSR